MQALQLSKHWGRAGAALAIGAAMAGCGDLSGIGGSQHYGCKAPSGVQCQSVSGNYFNSVRGTARLPSAGGAPPGQSTVLTRASLEARPAGGPQGAMQGYAPLPLRSPPRVLRLWVKAWEDAEHDLVDQSYVYVRVDDGKWSLDHVQRQVREAYAPLRPPAMEQAAAAPGGSSAPLSPPAGNGQSGVSAVQGLETAAAGVAMGGR